MWLSGKKFLKILKGVVVDDKQAAIIAAASYCNGRKWDREGEIEMVENIAESCYKWLTKKKFEENGRISSSIRNKRL